MPGVRGINRSSLVLAIFRAKNSEEYSLSSLSASTGVGQPAVTVDDPNSRIVNLRNSIIDLVEDRVPEVRGVTAAEESFIFHNGRPDEYCLGRIIEAELKELSYFNPGWPCDEDRQSRAEVDPRPLVIEGNPFRITKKRETASQIVLEVEKQ